MAENDNTAPGGASNHARVEIATAIYEAEILTSTVNAALEALRDTPEAQPVCEQLGVISKLISQLSKIVDRLSDAVRAHFARTTQ